MQNNQKIIGIFGAGGFLGKHLMRQLTKLDYRVKVATRNPFLKGYLKPLGNPGQIELFKTNIFNPEDVKQVLKNCDLIACEDTRVTRKLISSYEIKSKNLVSVHEHSSQQKLIFLIDKIKKGKSIALVSDAGTPMISDPGFKLVVLAINNGIKITPIPGPSAITASLVGSGLAHDKFFFIGFLPNKKNQRINALNKYKKIDSLLIFYESAKRIKKTITDMFLIFGNRKCVIARELTKYYETFYRGNLNKFKKIKKNLKGEITIIISSPEASRIDKIKGK